MASSIPTEDINSTQMVALFVDANGFAYIGENIHIKDPNGDGIFAFENAIVQVDGTIDAGFGLFTNSHDVSFIIGEDGLVSGGASRAINLAGDNGYIENAGRIVGASVGVYMDGRNEAFHNSGSVIVGPGFRNTTNTAVELDGIDGSTTLVENSGVI